MPYYGHRLGYYCWNSNEWLLTFAHEVLMFHHGVGHTLYKYSCNVPIRIASWLFKPIGVTLGNVYLNFCLNIMGWKW